jgi:hypothetical protein
MRISMILIASVLGIAAIAATLLAQQAAPPSKSVTQINVPLKFPAVGNLEAVKKWRFGRLERVDRTSNPEDILLYIRTGDEVVHQIIGPAKPLAELARQSNWITTETKTQASRADYIERMIAFDVDENGRLIALASLEPLMRSRSKLRRAM